MTRAMQVQAGPQEPPCVVGDVIACPGGRTTYVLEVRKLERMHAAAQWKFTGLCIRVVGAQRWRVLAQNRVVQAIMVDEAREEWDAANVLLAAGKL